MTPPGSDDVPLNTANIHSIVNSQPIENGNHTQHALINRNNSAIAPNTMEEDRKRFIEHVRLKLATQEKECDKIKDENYNLKNRISELESLLNVKTITNTKLMASTSDDEDILSKAKTLLFEKTKICKQQEQQMIALQTQVDATKDVLAITKDMLNVRNMENSHFQTRLDTLESKVKAERDVRVLNEKKLAVSKKMYTDLKNEYDVQSGIFKELRKSYEMKIELLNKQLQSVKKS